MIRFQCPGCGSSLSAKDELAGQVRACPKCKTPCPIPAAPSNEGDAAVASADAPENMEETPPADASVGQPPNTTDQGETTLPEPGHAWRLERLVRTHRYLVCDRTRLVATWENDGQGWLLKTNAGLVNAVRNRDQIPTQGDFKLIELKLEHEPSGVQLRGLCTYQLSKNYALANLARGDDPIVRTITGFGSLNRDQKNMVRQVLRERFMREVWEQAQAIIDYLGNNDFHTHAVDVDKPETGNRNAE